jgi:hypothetical protein
MAFTGTAFTDSMQLTQDNLEYSPDGVKLTYKRIKTGNISSQFLSSAAFEILKAFDDRPDQLQTQQREPRKMAQQSPRGNRRLSV